MKRDNEPQGIPIVELRHPPTAGQTRFRMEPLELTRCIIPNAAVWGALLVVNGERGGVGEWRPLGPNQLIGASGKCPSTSSGAPRVFRRFPPPNLGAYGPEFPKKWTLGFRKRTGIL